MEGVRNNPHRIAHNSNVCRCFIFFVFFVVQKYGLFMPVSIYPCDGDFFCNQLVTAYIFFIRIAFVRLIIKNKQKPSTY